MFSDKVLEKIFSREDVRQIPLRMQSIMIRAIEEVLEEENLIKEDYSDGNELL